MKFRPASSAVHGRFTNHTILLLHKKCGTSVAFTDQNTIPLSSIQWPPLPWKSFVLKNKPPCNVLVMVDSLCLWTSSNQRARAADGAADGWTHQSEGAASSIGEAVGDDLRPFRRPTPLASTTRGPAIEASMQGRFCDRALRRGTGDPGERGRGVGDGLTVEVMQTGGKKSAMRRDGEGKATAMRGDAGWGGGWGDSGDASWGGGDRQSSEVERELRDWEEGGRLERRPARRSSSQALTGGGAKADRRRGGEGSGVEGAVICRGEGRWSVWNSGSDREVLYSWEARGHADAEEARRLRQRGSEGGAGEDAEGGVGHARWSGTLDDHWLCDMTNE
jgi:hypothetical protein